MKVIKTISLSLVFVLSFSFLSEAQQEISDPRGYFDQYKALVTIHTKNEIQLKANLIYNDGHALYYKAGNLPSVQIISLTDINKITYADGSEEMILGSTTNNTIPVTPNIVLAPDPTSSASSTPPSEPVSQSIAATAPAGEEQGVPLATTTKRIVREDIWFSFGDLGDMAYIGENIYEGFSFTWGARTDYGRSDSWLAENADIRVSLNMGYGTYLAADDYFAIEETDREIFGFGGAFGLDFFLYQSDKFKIWSGTELGYLMYTEYGGDVEFGDYGEFIFAYGIYGGTQYRFTPNGLGLMVEAGASTFHYATFGLTLPIITRERSR